MGHGVALEGSSPKNRCTLARRRSLKPTHGDTHARHRMHTREIYEIYGRLQLRQAPPSAEVEVGVEDAVVAVAVRAPPTGEEVVPGHEEVVALHDGVVELVHDVGLEEAVEERVEVHDGERVDGVEASVVEG